MVFGGEELSPPQYGRVFIGIKPKNGNYLSNFIKSDIESKLKVYSVAGIMPKIVDLKYLFVEIDSNVYYNPDRVADSNGLKTSVIQTLETYADSIELNKFGARLKYSKLLKTIDDTNTAITSNITNVIMRRDLRPVINQFADYEICYGNQFHVNPDGNNIKTTGFRIDGYQGEVFLQDSPYSDLRSGTVHLVRKISPTESGIVRRDIGTIDYIKGEVMLNPLRIVSTTALAVNTPIIEIQANPESNDVIGKQDLFLQLDISKSSINVVPDTISTGNDISGSQYSVSSSFSNGSITR
jgi:hypothetical protein